jgi:hypothetical protein
LENDIVLTESAVAADVSYDFPSFIGGETRSTGLFLSSGYSSGQPQSSEVTTPRHSESHGNFSSRQAHDYIANVAGLSTVLGGGAVFDANSIYGATIGNTFAAANVTSDSRFKALNTLTNFNDVPMGNAADPTLTDGYMGECAYWTGHSLNLVQLVEIARRIGRALEPEVSEGLLPSFGAITSFDALVSSGTGMSAREVPTLYNLYQSGFSFNENPTRTYTAAHLGPSSLELAAGDLSLEGIELTTLRGQRVVSARERYWTPTVLGGAAEDIAPIMGSLLSGGRFYFGLFGEHSLTAAPFMGWSGLDRGFISRALGSVRSMYTKVEKPTILPAGVASAESTYASGVGRGALELVVELVLGSLGSRPRFGLGMAGFSDISADYGSETVTDQWGVDYAHRTTNPVNRRARADLSGTRANTALPSGRLFGDQMDAIENIVGGRGLREVAWDQGDSEALSDNHFGVTTPTRMTPNGFFSQSVPSEIVSSANATMINTKLVEMSVLPTRSQWGYLQLSTSGVAHAGAMVGSSIPASGPSPGVPVGQHTIAVVVSPTHVDWDGGAPSLVLQSSSPRTHMETTAANPDSMFSSLSTASAMVPSSGGGCVFGEPFITSSGNNFDSGEFLTTGVPMSVSYPHATPMQVILNALNTHDGSPNWVSDGNGRSTLAVTMDLEVRTILDSPTVAAHTLPLNQWNLWLSVVNQYTLSVGDEMVSNWDAMAELATSGTFSPAIGEDINISPLMDLVNTVELTFDSSNMQLVDESAINQLTSALDTLQDDGTVLPFDMIGHATGEVLNWKPPVPSGGVISEQMQYLLHTPEFLTSTSGQWTEAELEVMLSDFSLNAVALQGMTLERLAASSNANGGHSTFHCQMHSEHRDNTVPVGSVGLQTVDSALLLQNSIGPALTFGGWIGSHFGAMAIVSHVEQTLTSHPAPGGLNLNTGLDIPWHQVSFIYPDDPAHKMLYRPWRTYVDSAIAKELRMTFLNLGEDATSAFGPLGIEMIGVPKEFRFAELVRAGPEVARTFVMEKATSKTRMVNPDNRGILTFSRVSLLDPTSQRHIIPDVLREYNTAVDMMSGSHSSGSKGKVYNRAFIRELQAGRQIMRQR